VVGYGRASRMGYDWAGQLNSRSSSLEGIVMSESVYKVIELVGTSEESWEQAAKNAVERAGQTLRDLRIVEVSKLDLKVEENKITAFRARVNVSFKYED
jgi:flavin-binding protein dodecin